MKIEYWMLDTGNVRHVRKAKQVIPQGLCGVWMNGQAWYQAYSNLDIIPLCARCKARM